MAHEIVPINTPPLYKPETSSRMLDRALDLVWRREDPIGAELASFQQGLLETKGLIGITLGLAACTRDSENLPSEVVAAQPRMSQVPAEAIRELDRLLQEQHTRLQAHHLRLIRQYHFLHVIRCHLKMAEDLLTARMIIEPALLASTLTQLRDSYQNIYTWLQDRFEMDGYHLDSLLDERNGDLVETLFGLRLCQALTDLRGSDWFVDRDLWEWFQRQSYVEKSWAEQPRKPIGVKFVLYTEVAMLGHADFSTQLRISALFGALAANWTIRPATLVEALLAVMEHPDIGEHGWERISLGFGFALKDREREKFDHVFQELRTRLRGSDDTM